MQLFELIEMAPSHESTTTSYGVDIDVANKLLFSTLKKTEKIEMLFNWARKYQPCIIGRMGASKKRGIDISVFVIDEQDVAQGDDYLQQYLRQCRRDWKDQCKRGESDAVLYFLNIEKLSRVPPSSNLMQIFIKFAGFIFHEFESIQPDVIYTEAALVSIDKNLYLFKAGVNYFHTTAHLTSNHDRRIPGGAVISINAIGHYANNIVQLGVFKNIEDSVSSIRNFAWQSGGGWQPSARFL